MKILFGSDLHGLAAAYERYALLLKDHDIGILGGDQMDEMVPRAEVEELFGFELAREICNGYYVSFDTTVLNAKKKKLINILRKAGKTIYCVNGNHDTLEWNSEDFIVDIENKTVQLPGFELSGAWLNHPLKKRNKSDGLNTLRSHENMIVVCHYPPKGILDANRWGVESVTRFLQNNKCMFYLCGHVHEDAGQQLNMINAAYPEAKRFASIDTETKEVNFI